MTNEIECPFILGKKYLCGKLQLLFIGVNPVGGGAFVFADSQGFVSNYSGEDINTTPIREPRRITKWVVMADLFGDPIDFIHETECSASSCAKDIMSDPDYSNISKPFPIEIVEPEEAMP